jgi:hypothetical protein
MSMDDARHTKRSASDWPNPRVKSSKSTPPLMYGVLILMSFVCGKDTIPRRTDAWISVSLSAAPSSLKKTNSSSTPTGIDQPRRERNVHGKHMMARPFVSAISFASVSATRPASRGERVK